MVLLVSGDTSFLHKAMDLVRYLDFRVASGPITVTHHLRMSRNDIDRVIIDAERLNNKDLFEIVNKVHVYGQFGIKINIVTKAPEEERLELHKKVEAPILIFYESLSAIPLKS